MKNQWTALQTQLCAVWCGEVWWIMHDMVGYGYGYGYEEGPGRHAERERERERLGSRIARL